MNKLLSGAIVMALMAAAVPSSAQTNLPQTGTGSQTNQQIAPGTGGVSKPDMPGLPGSKSGPTVTPSGTGIPEASKLKQSGDESDVRGLPGNKSGATVKPSAAGR
jgi:hypothetical protein